jgi:FixJ family two-component response regulator
MADRDPTVYIVDDDEAMRHSLSWLMKTVGLNCEAYEAAQQFLEQYEPKGPGCLILDVRMPKTTGLALLDLMRERNLGLPVIVVSGHADVYTAVRAMKAGAIDFLEKPFSQQQLLELVHKALAQDAQRRYQQAECEECLALLESLTERERAVMEKLVSGGLNKTIAADLGLSQKTVEAYRARLMEKLGAKSPADVVRIYLAASQLRTKTR